MTTLYLACDWLVKFDQVPRLKDLNDLVKSLDSEFLILPCFFISPPVIDCLLVKIPEIEHARFLQQTEIIGFTDWQDTHSDLFKAEFAFNPYRKSAFTQRTWEARLRIAHDHNRPAEVILIPGGSPFNPSAFDDLSVGVQNSLKRIGIWTMDELLDMMDRGHATMLMIPDFDQAALDEVVAMLKAKGLLSNDEDK